MRRRTLLGTAAAGAAALVAGCTGTGSDPGNGSDGDPTDSPNATATGGGDGDYRVANRTFSVTSVECSTPASRVSGSIDPESPAPGAAESTVTLTGTLEGRNGCESARLASFERGPDGGTMAVGVETYVPEEDEGLACTQCLTAIDYELAVVVRGGRPGEVAVTHDGEAAGTVTFAE
ncbi:hypothetical protein [Halosegnis marinus]|uniref:Lipoprotein n=1 Tax=Halosegnis marinus TaxID=3034023 RepID=A0ABD5ZSW7_9EURY|nr:hypothetical protein [Halosegnis sp. DT85]